MTGAALAGVYMLAVCGLGLTAYLVVMWLCDWRYVLRERLKRRREVKAKQGRNSSEALNERTFKASG